MARHLPWKVFDAAKSGRLFLRGHRQSQVLPRYLHQIRIEEENNGRISKCIYDEVYNRSQGNPIDFWAEQAEHLVWTKKWDKVLDDSQLPFQKWYVFDFS